MTRCIGQGCRHYTAGGLCERCQRLTAIGAIVQLVFWHGAMKGVPEGGVMPVTFVGRYQVLRLTRALDPWQEDALDAVANLLTDHAVLRRRHRRDMNDEIREGSRAARDAWAEGERHGRDERGE